MARKISFDDTFKEADRVRTTWQSIPEFQMGVISFEDFAGVYGQARDLFGQYLAKKNELLGLKLTRDKKIRELSNIISRFRSSMIAQFGHDSSQYAQAGGIPRDRRKRRKRKSKG